MSGYELVVIGASWGGLHALDRVLRGLPHGFGVPIAIVQHRAADSDTAAYQEILRAPGLPQIVEAGDKEKIRPGHVYLAPADYHLLVDRPASFALSTEGRVQFSRPSIDVLFESAAEAYGERLVGVLLTGANEDGAAGLACIKRRGGFCIVQHPDGAERRTMPAAAIARGAAHKVLQLDRIGPFLGELTRQTAAVATEPDDRTLSPPA